MVTYIQQSTNRYYLLVHYLPDGKFEAVLPIDANR